MDLDALPGNDLVRDGLRDLARGEESVAAPPLQRLDPAAGQLRERGGMRRPVDAERIRHLMRELGPEADREVDLFLAGGVTAVLKGWRASTGAVDMKIEPESEALLRSLPRLKEKLEINIELAAPDQFIPEIPGWRDRSSFIAREGRISFYHYDFYAQALAKIERGHTQDLEDVRQMLDRGLIEPLELQGRYNQIEPFLFKFPALDPPSFRRAVAAVVAEG